MVKIAMELLIDGHITRITINGRNAKKVAIALQDALEQLGKTGKSGDNLVLAHMGWKV